MSYTGIYSQPNRKAIMSHVSDLQHEGQVTAEVGQLMRSNHLHAYRSGQWAVIEDVRLFFPDNPNQDQRYVYDLRWPDGATDFWPVVDPATSYEFKEPVS